MKISSVVCCESIAQDLGNKTVITAPIQVFKLINIPSMYSFSVSVGLVDVDKHGKDLFSMSILDPNGVIVNKIESMNLPIPPDEILNSESSYGLNINLDIRNLIFNQVGTYTLLVYEGDNIISESYFVVAL